MTKNVFKYGGCTKKELWDFINERHRIWCKRDKGEEAPWTDDYVLRNYKFTNVFRQLDTGTLALHKMIDGCKDKSQLAFNIIWYRLFNLADHAYHFVGRLPKNPDVIESYMRDRHRCGHKIFTSAHMTTGQAGRDKIDTYLDATRQAYKFSKPIVEVTRKRSMWDTFEYLKNLMMVGPFVAYEIVCDFRWCILLSDATDINTWANVGPGAARGLRRLGMPATLESMVELLKKKKLGVHIDLCTWPFELREIEHSLCEFDKYMRTLKDGGRPRQKYDGN